LSTSSLKRIRRFEVPAICLGNALGSCAAGTIPLWVAATLKSGWLSSSRIGWLASGELLAMAISALAVSVWGRRTKPRTVAVIAALVAATANVIAMLPMAEALIIGRLLSGFGKGALQGTLTGIAARRPDAQRVLALMQAVFVLLASLLLVVSSDLVDRFGVAGLFGIFASVGVMSFAGALIGLPASSVPDISVTSVARTRRTAPILACLALGMMILGVNTIWVYIVTIANSLGIESHTVGVVLAVVLPLAMLGPAAAHRLGERAGLLRPLLIGLTLMAMDGFFIVTAAPPFLFCVATSVLVMFGFFCVPYAIALLSRVDASGSFASAAPAFMMIGNAMAPALGGKLAGAGRFEAVALLSASCMALSIALFCAAVGLGAANMVLRQRGEAG
jgi:predicted MFS family arabinose efflux permease